MLGEIREPLLKHLNLFLSGDALVYSEVQSDQVANSAMVFGRRLDLSHHVLFVGCQANGLLVSFRHSKESGCRLPS
jgi:hypothetical protein